MVTKKKISIVIIIYFVFLTIFANSQFTPWPEMLLWPYLIDHGWLPYRDFTIVHSPLLPFLISIIFKFIGFGAIQLKVITWSLLAITGAIIYKYTKGNILAFTVWLALLIRYQGNALWFESLLTPLILLVFILIENKKYLVAGIAFALALFVKQTAIWFIFPLLLHFIFSRDIKKILKFAAGTLLIILSVFYIFSRLHLLSSYYLWSIKFGIFQLSFTSDRNTASIPQFIASLWPFSLILLVPFVSSRIRFINLFIWSIAGIMGAFPRWELFHFQPGLPFLALMISQGFTKLLSKKKEIRFFTYIYVIVTLLIVTRSLVLNWKHEDRFSEPEIKFATNFIKDNTSSDSSIYVLNTWDSVYTLANRLPSTRPWYPGLPWFYDLPGIQSDIVKSLKNVPPDLILFKEHDQSGLGSYRPILIENFVFSHYSKYKYFGSGYWILSRNI